MAQTPVWTQFANSPAGTIRNDDIFFADLTNGWSARGTDGVYRTTNAGQSWIKVIANTYPVAHFRCVGFASATRGWAGNLGPGSYDVTVTDTNILHETFNGGTDWSPVPAINDSGMKGFCAMHVMDSQHIYGAGRVRGPAYFAKSENGGASWWVTNLTAAGVMGGLMDVYFKDATNGFVVGMNTNLFAAPPYYGSIARTTNGGLNWQVLVTTTVPNSYFWKLSWPSANVGYASLQQNGAAGTIIFYKTTDGGATWSSNGIPNTTIGVAAGTTWFLQSIGFVSDTEGWMGGSTSTALTLNQCFIHTTNGGVTWTPEGYDNTRGMNRIRFVSPTLGHASGRTLHVFHVPISAFIQPTNQLVSLGSTVIFNATVQGTVPLARQWRFNGANISGAIATSLTMTNVQATNTGNYDIVASDFSGSVTSSVATLVLISVVVPPGIMAQPQSVVVSPSSNATFTVAASGTAPLRYQWRFNNTNLSGATNTSYTRTNSQSADVGNYTVVVTNIAGSITSIVATLTLAFGDDFDSYASPVTVTNIGTTNGYKIFFNAASGALDFKAIFGFDYSTVTYPTTIPPAPTTLVGSTRGLYLSVNKDATAAAVAVNLYPVSSSGSGNFALKFDLWLNGANLGTSTEHALFGINHSGNITNRIGLATCDGLMFAVDTDGNVAATTTALGDYAVLRGDGNGNPPVLMLTNNTTFGPTPVLGPQFDNLNPGISALFPSKTIPGWGNSLNGSAGLGWVRVEVRQVGSLITWLLNNTAIAQYTNSTAYTNGSVMIGYNDFFNSIGDSNSFAIFDNIRVEPIVVVPVMLLSPQVVGDNFSFSFATEPYESYTVQRATNLIAPTWLAYTNVVGNGSPINISIPLTPGNSAAQYFRVSRP